MIAQNPKWRVVAASPVERPSSKESANLDVLRSIAVLSVFVFHTLRTLGVDGEQPTAIWALGRFGVLLFFVHTSFVLMQSLSRMEFTGKWLYLAFYIRRAFRIYPLSILCVATVFAFHIPTNAWSTHPPEFSWSSLLANLTLVQNVTYKWAVSGPLWSLPYEIQMYVLLPAIYLMCRRWRSAALSVVLWMAFAAASLVQPRISERLDFVHFGPCFMGGILAYQLSGSVKRRLAPAFLWPLAILAITAAFTIFDRLRLGWIECLLLGAAIPHFAEIQWPWCRTAAHLIAKYSYGIYLTHMPLLWLFFVRLSILPMALKASLFALAAMACPVALYHWIEHPGILAGIRITQKFPRRIA